MVRLNRLSHLPPGLYAAQLLREAGAKINVVELGDGPPEGRESEGIEYRTLHPFFLKYAGSLRPLFLFVSSVFALWVSILKTGRPSLLVAHGIFEQLVCLFIAVPFRIPLVIHVHEIYTSSDLSPLNRLFFLFNQPALRSARLLIFPSPERRNLYVNRYHLTQPIQIAANTPRLKESLPKGTFRERLSLQSHHRLMSYIGGIGGANAIVEGIIAVGRVPGLHFAVAGWSDPDYLKKAHETAASHGLQDRVHFLGALKDEKWDLLVSSDITLCVYKPLALRLECNAMASNKLMESISMGTPAVGGTGRDFKAFFETYSVGAFVESSEPLEISRAINGILSKSESRESIRKIHLTELNYEQQFAASRREIMGFL